MCMYSYHKVLISQIMHKTKIGKGKCSTVTTISLEEEGGVSIRFYQQYIMLLVLSTEGHLDKYVGRQWTEYLAIH